MAAREVGDRISQALGAACHRRGKMDTVEGVIEDEGRRGEVMEWTVVDFQVESGEEGKGYLMDLVVGTGGAEEGGEDIDRTSMSTMLGLGCHKS